MVHVETSIIIEKPILEVANYASNPENAPLWYDNIQSAIWVHGDSLDLGNKVAFVANFLGKEMRYTYEFTKIIDGKKLVMQTSEGPFPMKTIYQWEPISENQTKMTLINSGEPTGFSKIMAPFMSRMMRKANKKDLSKIKVILETT